MANEIDRIMALDPLSLSAQDIDTIIAYERKQRAVYESGGKPKKETGPKVSLAAVVETLAPAPPQPTIRRRF